MLKKLKLLDTLPLKSGFEKKVCEDLIQRKKEFKYEPFKINYIIPEISRRYTPDIVLPNGIIIECKGWFKLDDRKKMLHVRNSNPNLDIRLLFMSAKEKIRRGSKITFGVWCDRNNFLWAEGIIPKAWLQEKRKEIKFGYNGNEKGKKKNKKK